MPTDARGRFLRLLKNDILKLDLAELDFGVYRVLAHRRQEIERFFDETLPRRIQEALATGGADRTAQLDQRLATLRDQITQTAQALGLERAFDAEGALADALRQTPKGQEYMKLAEERKKADAGAGFADTEESQIFAHLYTFFSRYYRDGDFLPQPRRGRKAQFSVPYQGEDVHFSWRGRGNHYVKTAEELARYDFRFPAERPTVRVRFELVRADEEENNVKGKTRYFLPIPGEARVEQTEEGSEVFVVPFEFRPLKAEEDERLKAVKKDKEEDADTIQQAALDEAFPRILEAAPGALKATEGSEALKKHLRRYARKNRTDYFVNPDLGGFLRAELDYFLKNEVLDVDALMGGDGTGDALADRLAKLRVIRSIAEDVIALLHQIEDVQARLFEKRKLVLKADYLAPVFALRQELYAEVIANDKQRQAWADLFGVELGENDVKELKRRPTLVVDTTLFDDEFKERLLASFKDLEAALGGILVKGDNYGALRTLGPILDGSVAFSYNDPPYNTGDDGFLYKDDFSRHSTWLTMMEERVRLIKDVLKPEGALFLSIDDHEQSRLVPLLESIYGEEGHVTTFIWRKVDSPNDNKVPITPDHEYIPAFTSAESSVVFEQKPDPSLVEAYPHEGEDGVRYRDRLLKKNGKDSLRSDRETMWFPIEGPDGKPVYPIHDDGREARWSKGEETVQELIENNALVWKRRTINGEETWVPYTREFAPENPSRPYPSIWLESKTTRQAKAHLRKLGLLRAGFDTPKPIDLMRGLMQLMKAKSGWFTDFFAGSATTGHAVIEQNRDDEGERRFVLVDQGEYFDTLVLPRIQKAMHARVWKNGRPEAEVAFDRLGGLDMLPEWIDRTPRLVQVLRLESYEGSLNALETPAERSARLRGQEDLFGQDYLLRYFLPLETGDSAPLLNLKALEDPFAYRLRVHSPDGIREQPVDLVETFPLVMGLRPVRRWTAAHERAMPGDGARPYTLMEARERNGGLVLVVWRPVAGLDAAAEKAWLEGQLTAKDRSWDNYSKVWMNATGALPKGEELDAPFRRALLARDPHVARPLPSGDSVADSEVATLIP